MAVRRHVLIGGTTVLAGALGATAPVVRADTEQDQQAPDRTNAQPVDPATAPAQALPSGLHWEDPAATHFSGSTYVVRSGDTLWTIASRRLGAGAPFARVALEAHRIRGLNADLSGVGDRDALAPGTPLAVA